MRPALRRLADAYGILPSWVDVEGRRHEITDTTREALLAAWGVDAGDEPRARAALEARTRERRARLLAPARVASDAHDAACIEVAADLPDGTTLEAFCALLLESGDVRRLSASATVTRRRARLVLDVEIPCGVHELRVTCGDRTGKQTLCVVPPRCDEVGDGEQHAAGSHERAPRGVGLHEGAPGGVEPFAGLAGLCASLYAVRSRRDWGVGDLTDLAALGAWAGRRGFAFLGTNPLHALRNAGAHVSPYSPLSRLFLNDLYIDPLAVPEWDGGLLDGAGRRVEALAQERLVRYDEVARLKRAVLARLFERFGERELGHDTARARDYRRFVAAGGVPLQRYALFRALEARHGMPWHAWPAGVRAPASPEAERFAKEHAGDVAFETWLQFETDRQLGLAADAFAAEGGTRGLYLDLAVGSAPDGADTWSWPGLFLDGVRLGAPPDDFNTDGQEWGLPAIDPHALADDGCRYWRLMLDASMRHAGMLRIDHVAGLVRQWWIPRGMDASAGAYVRQPSADLFGLLALASRRANTIVVGEDLGTVPPAVPRALRQWGLLGSRVLYFARTTSGGFRAMRTQPRRVLLTATTHDLPTLAGFLGGRDLEQRDEARGRRRERKGGVACEAGVALEAPRGAPSDPGAPLDAQRRARGRERLALVRRLVEERAFGPLDPTEIDAGAALRGAIHRLIARSPALAVGVWLDDLVGEPDAVNLPGFAQDDWPSWSRRLGCELEALDDDDGVQRALGDVTRIRERVDVGTREGAARRGT